MSGVSRRIKD